MLGERGVVDRMETPRRRTPRIGLVAEQELRAREQHAQRGLDAGVETRARGARIVERHQQCDVLLARLTPIGATRELRDDFGGADTRRRLVSGLAREDALTRGRIADPGDLEGPLNRRPRELRALGPYVNVLGVPNRRLEDVLRARGTLDEGEANLVRTGSDLGASFHPLGDKLPRLRQIPHRRVVVRGPTDLRGMHDLAIDQDLELVGHVLPFDAGVGVVDRPEQRG